jgi:uridylate kinase
MAEIKYRRILLKISGEGLSGAGGFGLAKDELDKVAGQVEELVKLGIQPAIVVGAGNLVRGATLSKMTHIHRVTGDQMGMMATVINALALQDVLEGQDIPTRVLSAIEVTRFCEPFIRRRAIKHLDNNRVVILAGGTGNPFFTTDTCAALRAAEIRADVLIKATKVDGVYSADPVNDPQATKYDKLSFDEVLRDNLRVMDHTAISMCKENNIDIIVCNLMEAGTVARVAKGEAVGTLITNKVEA